MFVSLCFVAPFAVPSRDVLFYASFPPCNKFKLKRGDKLNQTYINIKEVFVLLRPLFNFRICRQTRSSNSSKIPNSTRYTNYSCRKPRWILTQLADWQTHTVWPNYDQKMKKVCVRDIRKTGESRLGIYIYVLIGHGSDVVVSDWCRTPAPPIRGHYVTSVTF